MQVVKSKSDFTFSGNKWQAKQSICHRFIYQTIYHLLGWKKLTLSAGEDAAKLALSYITDGGTNVHKFAQPHEKQFVNANSHEKTQHRETHFWEATLGNSS